MAEDMNVSSSRGNEGANSNQNTEKQDQAQKFGDCAKNQGAENGDQKSGLTAESNGAKNDNSASKTDYKQGADYKNLTSENKGVVDKYMDKLNSAGPFNDEQKQGANARGNWISGVVNDAQKAGINVADGTTAEEYKGIIDKVQSTPGESERLAGLQDDYTNKLQNSANGTENEELLQKIADGHVEFGYKNVNGALTTVNEAGNDNKTIADAATDLNYMTSTGKFANASL